MKKTKNLMLAAALLTAVTMLVAFNIKEKREKASSRTAVMVTDWERAKAYTLEYLNASTDEVINFKPTAEMRSFGQQMLHLAEANYGFASTASGQANPIPFGSLEKSDKYKTKDAVAKEVMASYDFVISAVHQMPESKMGEMVKLFNKFDVSRGAAMEKAFEHQTHHRGQTTVYLRLKGIAPPQEKLF
jgi:uncharacterized damage-inducible protein DinB